MNEYEGKRIQSIDRAMEVLDAFSSDRPRLKLAEIGEVLGVPKSTAHGIASSLRAAGYLAYDSESRLYSLGLRILNRAAILMRTYDIVRVAEPLLVSLRDLTQENTHLGVEHDDEVVYLLKLEASASLGIRSDVGKRVPLYCTAMGKALLAQLGAARVRSLSQRVGLNAQTPHTITDVDALLDDLALTRDRGFSLEREEYQLGGVCVGAPLHGPGGELAGAISVSVPTVRLSPERLESIAHAVMATAADISRISQGSKGKSQVSS